MALRGAAMLLRARTRSVRWHSMAHQTLPEPFLAALVSGRTVAEAAEAAGISRRTAFRRLADPDVQRQIDELRASTIEHATARLLGLVDLAANTLAAVMSDDGAAASPRVSAARAVFIEVLHLREAGEVESRLTEVERLIARRPPGPIGLAGVTDGTAR